MKLLDLKPLSLTEVKSLAGDLEEKKNLKIYLKKFGKLNEEKSKMLSEEILKLDNMKIKEEDIVKIVDFLPKNNEELNKIFREVSLDEKEANDLLEIVRKY